MVVQMQNVWTFYPNNEPYFIISFHLLCMVVIENKIISHHNNYRYAKACDEIAW